MSKQRFVVLSACACVGAGLAAAAAAFSSSPVGSLPPGPDETVQRAAGTTFAVSLPKPTAAGRVWRLTRAHDSAVVRPAGQATATTGVRSGFRTVGPGTTRIVFAVRRGTRADADAAPTLRVVVAKAGCPDRLLPLTANPIGPAVTAALVGDVTKNRPQVVGATVASHDTLRGPQVKARCGAVVWRRTVVVYVTDRALLPSQSASQRVLFVGRTPAGYRVWQRAH